MISLQNSMEPNAAWFLMETESTAGALVHSALAIKGDRKISYWILKNITFPFTTTNLQYNCGMKSTQQWFSFTSKYFSSKFQKKSTVNIQRIPMSSTYDNKSFFLYLSAEFVNDLCYEKIQMTGINSSSPYSSQLILTI